jgi:hypothetical protein
MHDKKRSTLKVELTSSSETLHIPTELHVVIISDVMKFLWNLTG